MLTWIRAYRRKFAVFSVVLALALLGMTDVISVGTAGFFSLLTLTFLYKFRSHGTFTVTYSTTSADVAVHAGAAIGGTKASHAEFCSNAS